ncbi:MAG TPA: cytochrome c biogenesis protein CcsA [Bacteroidia bacterium]
MAKNWWKILAVLIVIYTIIAGFLLPVPRLDILNETIRNLYFHVPIWFAMLFLMGVSVYQSIMYLGSNKIKKDIIAVETANVGIVFSVLGILTGMLWARYTWGTWWTTDTKLNGVAITFLIYTAYFILRSSIEDEQKKARISAIYNIFAFVMMIVFVMILPRMSASLHPGNGGNPAFGKFDLDNTMRMVFYPACIAWIMIGCWVAQLRVRMGILTKKIIYDETV